MYSVREGMCREAGGGAPRLIYVGASQRRAGRKEERKKDGRARRHCGSRDPSAVPSFSALLDQRLHCRSLVPPIRTRVLCIRAA